MFGLLWMKLVVPSENDQLIKLSHQRLFNWSNKFLLANHEQKTYRVDNPSWLLGEFTLHSSSRALLADKSENYLFILILIFLFIKVFVFTTNVS